MRKHIEVQVIRGKQIESLHRVSAICLDISEKILLDFGQTTQKIFPRSSIKPLQALPIITCGALEKFNISSEELALATASHNGEAAHVSAIKKWLDRLNLSESFLECGAHQPAYQQAALELAKTNLKFSALHNNCSGKHTGMLSIALAIGADPKNYVRFGHPVQEIIRNTIEDFCDLQVSENEMGIDGCSIPTYFLAMPKLALGMARFAAPENLDSKYTNACKQVYQAMTKHPFLVAGTERYCTRMINLLAGKAVVKTGAEGVMFAAIPSLKVGVVLKAEDGGTRASECALTWILNQLGLFTTSEWTELKHSKIKNWNDIETGHIFVNN